MAVIQDPNKVQQNGPQGSPNGQPLQTVGTATPAGSAPSGSPTATTQANNLAQRQGSGRFTNLQKYIQANQGAGSRIAGQIGQKVGQNIQKEQDKASNYYQKLGQSIEQSKQTAEQGQGFKGQLQNIGTQIGQSQEAGFEARPQQQLNSIQQFTQSPDFQKFQDIQAGRGIDESLLALQQQKAAGQAQTAQQAAQQANQQLGSEGGRFQLLQNAFGGANRPGYTTGQQRLDQALLGGNLGSVQSDVGARLKSAQELAKQASGQAQEVGRISQQERDLISGINTQAGTNEQAYLNMLQSYVDPLQAQRQSEFESLGGATGTYVPKVDPKTGKVIQQAYQPGYNTEQMARLGLTDQNQGVYNVFKDEAFTNAMKEQDPAKRNAMLANVIASKGQEARTAQDVANQEDLARYRALQSIIGKDAADNLTKGSGKVGEDVIGRAYEAKTGDAGLKERLDAAQTQFDEASNNQKYSQLYKSGGLYNVNSANFQDLLNKGLAGINVGYGKGNMGGGMSASEGMFNSPLSPFYNTDVYKAASGVTGVGGRLADASVANQFKNFINQQNYNQTIGGRRDTFLDTIADQARAKNGMVPDRIDQTPITGTDPSLNYLNQIVGKMPVKGK